MRNLFFLLFAALLTACTNHGGGYGSFKLLDSGGPEEVELVKIHHSMITNVQLAKTRTYVIADTYGVSPTTVRRWSLG